jgi:hypothetical protein
VFRGLDKRVHFKDLAWRKKELITLKLMHDRARDHQQELLRRAGVALLYAHWEGFVKSAATSYVELVARQNLRYRDLQPNFIALGAKKYLNQFAATSRGTILCAASEFFINQLGDRARLVWESAVETKSNLSAQLTRDIVVLLGLDYRPFEVHERTVIERLREWRNGIAHGRYLSVRVADYHELHEKILDLLDELRTQISNAALGAMYRTARTRQ